MHEEIQELIKKYREKGICIHDISVEWVRFGSGEKVLVDFRVETSETE